MDTEDEQALSFFDEALSEILQGLSVPEEDIATFLNRNLDMETFLILTDEDLICFGIKDPAVRNTILSAIGSLQDCVNDPEGEFKRLGEDEEDDEETCRTGTDEDYETNRSTHGSISENVSSGVSENEKNRLKKRVLDKELQQKLDLLEPEPLQVLRTVEEHLPNLLEMLKCTRYLYEHSTPHNFYMTQSFTGSSALLAMTEATQRHANELCNQTELLLSELSQLQDEEYQKSKKMCWNVPKGKLFVLVVTTASLSAALYWKKSSIMKFIVK